MGLRRRTLQTKHQSCGIEITSSDMCGIRNLLKLLEKQGFTEMELRKIEARIAARLGTTIIKNIK